MPNHGQGGRPLKAVDDYKDEILDLLHTQHWKQHEVVAWLADNKDIQISSSTLKRRLQLWNSHRLDRTEDTEQLRDRIHYLFCKIGASDDEMLEWMQKEGFKITSGGLVRIRKEMGFKRWEQTQEVRDHVDEVV